MEARDATMQSAEIIGRIEGHDGFVPLVRGQRIYTLQTGASRTGQNIYIRVFVATGSGKIADITYGVHCYLGARWQNGVIVCHPRHKSAAENLVPRLAKHLFGDEPDLKHETL